MPCWTGSKRHIARATALLALAAGTVVGAVFLTRAGGFANESGHGGAKRPAVQASDVLGQWSASGQNAAGLTPHSGGAGGTGSGAGSGAESSAGSGMGPKAGESSSASKATSMTAYDAAPAPTTPLVVPDLSRYRAEVDSDPHGTPPSVLAFAQHVGKRHAEARRDPAVRTAYFAELGRCAEAPDDAVPKAARAFCLVRLETLAREFPSEFSAAYAERYAALYRDALGTDGAFFATAPTPGGTL